MLSNASGARPELPQVDERLAAPETRFEVIDGEAIYGAPADEPHGNLHGALAALVRAHRGEGYEVAIDMLTRTSRTDDIAPDVSLYPAAHDPRTGGRQLEELAFEIASTQSLGRVAVKAVKLAARGVRRVFAVDVERARVLEWDQSASQWAILDRHGRIEDRALAVPMPVEALIDAARAHDAIARALRTKRHPEFVAEHAEGVREGRAEGVREGRAEALRVLLASRGLAPTEAELRRIRAERDLDRLDRWIGAAATCADVASLLADEAG